jgi:hypothetical protein
MLTSLSFITSGDPPKLVFDVLDEDEDEVVREVGEQCS